MYRKTSRGSGGGGWGRPIKCQGWKGERIGVKFNSHRIGLEHGRCFIVLANVTSCEKASDGPEEDGGD